MNESPLNGKPPEPALQQPQEEPPIQQQPPIQPPTPPRVRIPKPDGFDSRPVCGAPLDAKDLSKGYCQTPLGQCWHCGKWCRSRGYPCPRRRVHGKGVCTMHGGAPGSALGHGPANAGYKHGRHSALRPKHLRALFDQAMMDPELLSARGLVAMWHSRCAELVRQLDSSGSGRLFIELRREFALLEKNKTAEQMAKIKQMIESGATYADQWAELETASEQRAKYQQLEWKRLVDMQQMVSREQALVILQSMVDSVHRHVKDREVLKKIAADYRLAQGLEVVGTAEGTA